MFNCLIVYCCTTTETRTQNLQIRSLLLYPIELWQHEKASSSVKTSLPLAYYPN
nr:MAG TPA: hypothetical protein [Crassvirales sp.]